MRRTYRRRPGLKEAAAVLNVSFSHLRRVLDGERQSRSLVSRFKNLLCAPAASVSESARRPVLQVPPEIAAAENLSPFYFATLARLGLQVVAVRVPIGPSCPASNFPNLGTDLEQELRAAGVGQFDSEFYTEGIRWLFYHVSDLGKAIRTLKAGLESRGILPTATILHVETPSELRVWWPQKIAAEPVDAKLEDEPPS